MRLIFNDFLVPPGYPDRNGAFHRKCGPFDQQLQRFGVFQVNVDIFALRLEEY